MSFRFETLYLYTVYQFLKHQGNTMKLLILVNEARKRTENKKQWLYKLWFKNCSNAPEQVHPAVGNKVK